MQHGTDQTRLSREAHQAPNRSDRTVRYTPHTGQEHGVEENRTKHKSLIHRITTHRHTSRREFGHDRPTHDTARYIETTHTILRLNQRFVLNRPAHSFHLLVIRSHSLKLISHLGNISQMGNISHLNKLFNFPFGKHSITCNF